MNSATTAEIENQIEQADPGQVLLRRELEETPETNHYAVLYESRREQLNAALSFIQIGLENDERCLYVAAENTVEDIETELEALGIDVCEAIEDGQLNIRSADNTYLEDGFDPDRMFQYLLDEAEESLADGYAGFRVTGEMSWVLDANVSFDDVLEYETNYQEETTEHEVVALCQYNKLRFDIEDIVDIIHTHPRLIYRGRVCGNPYYTPPEEFLGAEKPELEATRMLETLYDITTAQKAIRDREQRLAVTNRVLRHNLRNDMNVIRGHAEILQDHVDEENPQASADQIVATTDKLLLIAEKANQIEKTLSVDHLSPKTRGLHQIVDDAVGIADAGAELTVKKESDGDIQVRTIPEIDLAFKELFDAVSTHSDTPPTVSIGVSDSKFGTVAQHEISVRIEEGSLPEDEVQALIDGSESPLMHSSGLELWLTNWILDKAGGELRFQCDDQSCSEIKILLPAATQNSRPRQLQH